MKNKKYAFTVIELLIVITIMAALTSILTPVFLTSSSQADETKKNADINSISKAVSSYMADFIIPFKKTQTGYMDTPISIMYLSTNGYLGNVNARGKYGYSIRTPEARAVWVLALENGQIKRSKVTTDLRVYVDIYKEGDFDWATLEPNAEAVAENSVMIFSINKMPES